MQNSGKCCELMRNDVLISSIVWFKVYLPNKSTPKNSVKKLGPENRLISWKNMVERCSKGGKICF